MLDDTHLCADWDSSYAVLEALAVLSAKVIAGPSDRLNYFLAALALSLRRSGDRLIAVSASEV
jgi:hypothetical protein